MELPTIPSFMLFYSSLKYFGTVEITVTKKKKANVTSLFKMDKYNDLQLPTSISLILLPGKIVGTVRFLLLKSLKDSTIGNANH